MTAFLAARLGSSDVFFDIGTHIGYHRRIALKLKQAEGKVVAFEPDPSTASELRRAFGDARLNVREEAVGRENHHARVWN